VKKLEETSDAKVTVIDGCVSQREKWYKKAIIFSTSFLIKIILIIFISS